MLRGASKLVLETVLTAGVATSYYDVLPVLSDIGRPTVVLTPHADAEKEKEKAA